MKFFPFALFSVLGVAAAGKPQLSISIRDGRLDGIDRLEPPLDSSGSARSGEIDLVPKHLSMSDSMIEKIGEDMGPKHLSLSDSMLEKIEEEKLLLRQEMETMRKEMQTLKRRYFG